MNLDVLYPLVSEAIRRAEVLTDLGDPGARGAHAEVSRLEERITEILPASDPEGALARRGAVRAALSARNYERVRLLTARYLDEAKKAPELGHELTELAKAAEKQQTARFPLAAARYGLPELERLARAFFQQGAPFPIAS